MSCGSGLLCRENGTKDFIPFHFDPKHFCPEQRVRNGGRFHLILRRFFLAVTRDELFRLFSQKDIPVAKVYSLDKVFGDPQVLHRGMIKEAESPAGAKTKQVGIAVKLSAILQERLGH